MGNRRTFLSSELRCVLGPSTGNNAQDKSYEVMENSCIEGERAFEAIFGEAHREERLTCLEGRCP